MLFVSPRELYGREYSIENERALISLSSLLIKEKANKRHSKGPITIFLGKIFKSNKKIISTVV